MELHGFLNIDKPLGWTSHDVVGRLRRILNIRKIGHAGTLDPAATGVLVVGVGRATRFLDFVQYESKSYLAHVVLGHESETADIDGRINTPVGVAQSEQIVPPLSHVKTSAASFIGEIDQVPPKFSALKQGGEPLYRRARRGEDVDVPVRTVRIDAVEVLAYHYPDLLLSVRCGPGVYIRSLARDIAAQLETSGYLHHLVRTNVGVFDLTNALSMTSLAKLPFPESWASIATSIDTGMPEAPAFKLSENQTTSWYHGRSIRVNHAFATGDSPVRVYSADRVFAGIAAPTEASRHELRPRIVLGVN